MKELFDWIRNITYYLIFITVVVNLLPNKKYEKYIRFFAGMVLILLVLKPITGGLNLDEKLAYYFETISLKKEAGELAGELSNMDEKRLEKMIASYEEAVGVDLKSMAETAGFACKCVKAEIDKNQDNSTFGHVVHIAIILMPSTENGTQAETIAQVQKIEGVKVEIEKPKITKKEPIDVRKKRKEENSRISGLRKRIAEYYELEEQDIEIQMEDGKG